MKNVVLNAVIIKIVYWSLSCTVLCKYERLCWVPRR